MKKEIEKLKEKILPKKEVKEAKEEVKVGRTDYDPNLPENKQRWLR
jgi:hypothetical protein